MFASRSLDLTVKQNVNEEKARVLSLVLPVTLQITACIYVSRRANFFAGLLSTKRRGALSKKQTNSIAMTTTVATSASATTGRGANKLSPRRMHVTVA